MHPDITIELQIEKVIAYITPHLSMHPPDPQPTYFHSIRVGIWLWQHGYTEDIVLAGFLHDMLENTAITYEDLVQDRGESVADLVQANTKDMLLSSEQTKEFIERCLAYSEAAAIIKTADMFDNLLYYLRTENDEQLTEKIADVIFFLMKNEYTDPVFEELGEFVGELQQMCD